MKTGCCRGEFVKNRDIKLSIIVPIYNVERYLKKCLNSLVRQTYKNIEIILIDDGSTDYSGRICDEYAKTDQRIIVKHKANGGLISARKEGIMLATGEYVTYVDSDDWIEINAYKELIKLLQVYHPDVLTYNFIKEYQDYSVERKETLSRGLYSREQFLCEAGKCIDNAPFFCSSIHVTVWSKIFKADLIKKYQMNINEDIQIGEDMAVVFPIILNMNNIYITQQSFYHYRARRDSINWVRTDHEYSRYLKLISSLKNAWKNWGKGNQIDNRYLIYIYYYYLILCAPEQFLIKESKFILFPQIKKEDNIIIYGKGVFANRIKNCIESINFCNIIGYYDKVDASQIKYLSENAYEYVIIAITDHAAIESSLLLLEGMGINRTKILYVQKENLTLESLPIEVQALIE